MSRPSTLEDLLERVVIGGVAVTARALAATAGELTFLQWRVLVVLGDAPEGLNVGEVGRRIGASPPSATRVLRRLEGQGLVRTARDEADRRRVVVRLTVPGATLRETVMEHRRALLRTALDDAAVSPGEAVEQALMRIAAALDRARDPRHVIPVA